MGYNPWGHKVLDVSERLSLSSINKEFKAKNFASAMLIFSNKTKPRSVLYETGHTASHCIVRKV